MLVTVFLQNAFTEQRQWKCQWALSKQTSCNPSIHLLIVDSRRPWSTSLQELQLLHLS